MCHEKESSHLLDCLLFPNLFKAFRIAVHPKKLTIAFLAVVLISAVGWFLDIHKTVVIDPLTQVTELHIYINEASHLPAFLGQSDDNQQRVGFFHTLYQYGAEQFHQALYAIIELDISQTVTCIRRCFNAVEWALRYHTFYSLVFFTVTLCITCISGGAICRAAALQFAQGERTGLVESLRFSMNRFFSLLAAPLIPIGIIIFLGLFITCLGLLGNIPWLGELLLGLGIPIVLCIGCVAVFIIVGAICGFSLMFPSLAFEDSECFMAINHSYRFVYARPWRFAFYAFIASIYGAISYVFVRLLAYGMLLISYRFLQLGFVNDNMKLHQLWPEPTLVNIMGLSTPQTNSWAQAVSAWLIHLSLLLVLAVLIAFVVSFYFTINTIIYALLRKHVDNIPLATIQTSIETDEPKDQASVKSPADLDKDDS